MTLQDSTRICRFCRIVPGYVFDFAGLQSGYGKNIPKCDLFAHILLHILPQLKFQIILVLFDKVEVSMEILGQKAWLNGGVSNQEMDLFRTIRLHLLAPHPNI